MDEHEHHGNWNISYSGGQMKEKDVHRNREHHYQRNRHKSSDQDHRSADNLEKLNHIEEIPGTYHRIDEAHRRASHGR